MATFANLPADQVAAIESLTNAVRSYCLDLAHLGNHGRAIAATYSGNVETMLAGLDSGEVIPNTTNLAGAQGLVKADLINLVGYLMTVSDTTDNAAGSINTNFHRGLYAKAVGTTNLVG